MLWFGLGIGYVLIVIVTLALCKAASSDRMHLEKAESSDRINLDKYENKNN